MKSIQPTKKPGLRSKDTLFRPDFMLPTTDLNRLSKTQVSQRKALNTSRTEETNALLEIASWQDR
jgi:hypothetical protein